MRTSRRRVVGKALLATSWGYATLVSVYVLGQVFGQEGFWVLVPGGVRVVAVLLAAGVLALEVVWAVLFLRELVKGEGSQYLLSRTKEGTARISLRAIQASLMRRVRDLPEVIGARVTVRRPETRRLRIEVSYTTTEDRNAIQVSESLRRLLRERFEELVQSEEGFEVEFDIKIDGFVPAPGPARKEEETRKEPEPFTGPRYPID